MFVPGVGQAANGFAETNGKFGNSLQALDGARRQAVAPRQQQLRIPENSSQWIVDFVTKNFSEVSGQFVGPGNWISPAMRSTIRARRSSMPATMDKKWLVRATKSTAPL